MMIAECSLYCCCYFLHLLLVHNVSDANFVDRKRVYIFSPMSKGYFSYKSTKNEEIVEPDTSAKYPQPFYLTEKNNLGGLSVSVYDVKDSGMTNMPVLDLRWDNDMLILFGYHGYKNQIFYLNAVNSKYLKIVGVDLCLTYDDKQMVWRKQRCKKAKENPKMLFRILGDVPVSKHKSYSQSAAATKINTEKYMQQKYDEELAEATYNERKKPRYLLSQCRTPESRSYDPYDNFVRNRLKDAEKRDRYGIQDVSIQSIDAQKMQQQENTRENTKENTRENTRENKQLEYDTDFDKKSCKPSKLSSVDDYILDITQKPNKCVSIEDEVKSLDMNCDFINDFTKKLDVVVGKKNEQVVQKTTKNTCKQEKIECGSMCCAGSIPKIPDQPPPLSDVDITGAGDLTQSYKQISNTVARLEKNTPQILFDVCYLDYTPVKCDPTDEVKKI